MSCSAFETGAGFRVAAEDTITSIVYHQMLRGGKRIATYWEYLTLCPRRGWRADWLWRMMGRSE